jgi:hypothetical protein
MRTFLTKPSRKQRIALVFALIARWVPGLGFVFAALVIVAAALEASIPGKNASNEAWTSYYADSGNRHKEKIAFLLIGVAGLCFLQFLGSLRGALARAEGEPARITTAAVASGAVFIAIAISSHAVGTAVSWSVGFYGPSYTVDPNTARLLAGVSYGLFAMSLFAAAAMALATATIALSTRTLPAWLGWLSVLAAIAGVLGILGLTSLVVLIWIAALSVYLVWPKPTPATGT